MKCSAMPRTPIATRSARVKAASPWAAAACPIASGRAPTTRGRTQQATIDKLHDILTRLLPQTRGLRLDHAWCGALGVPRDWCTTVGFDRESGVGWAGGYVGLGVSSSNLSGRTLRDLVLGRDTELTRLPWVNRTVKKWEPEPLRWLGVHSMYQLYRIADAREANGLARYLQAGRLGRPPHRPLT